MYEKVLFVGLLFLFAYLLKLFGVFKEEDSGIFINYVLYFALPALVIREVHDLEIDISSAGVVVFAWVVIILSVVSSFLIGKLMNMEDKTLRAFVLVSSFGNTAFMGYPFTFAMFGNDGMAYAVLYDQLGSFLLVITLGLFIATGKLSLKEVLLFPPFLALLLAFLFRGVKIPPFLQTFLDVSAMSLIPVVLFAIGLKFSPRNMSASMGNALVSVGIKMVLVPLGALVVLKLLGLGGVNYRVALLETSMPPMVMAGVLVIKYGLDDRLAVSSISLGILLSFVSVPLIMSLY